MPAVRSESLKTRFPPPLDAGRGRASLFVVFWGYGVLVSSALIAAFVVALYRGGAVTQQILIPGFRVSTPWALDSVWRCAAPSRTPWTMIAQLLTVAWAGNTLLVAGFLQLSLLETYAGL